MGAFTAVSIGSGRERHSESRAVVPSAPLGGCRQSPGKRPTRLSSPTDAASAEALWSADAVRSLKRRAERSKRCAGDPTRKGDFRMGLPVDSWSSRQAAAERTTGDCGRVRATDGDGGRVPAPSASSSLHRRGSSALCCARAGGSGRGSGAGSGSAAGARTLRRSDAPVAVRGSLSVRKHVVEFWGRRGRASRQRAKSEQAERSDDRMLGAAPERAADGSPTKRHARHRPRRRTGAATARDLLLVIGPGLPDACP
jgi:hypothetical protein